MKGLFVIMPGDSSTLDDSYIINPPFLSNGLYLRLSVIAYTFKFKKTLALHQKEKQTFHLSLLYEATALAQQTQKTQG